MNGLLVRAGHVIEVPMSQPRYVGPQLRFPVTRKSWFYAMSRWQLNVLRLLACMIFTGVIVIVIKEGSGNLPQDRQTVVSPPQK